MDLRDILKMKLLCRVYTEDFTLTLMKLKGFKFFIYLFLIFKLPMLNYFKNQDGSSLRQWSPHMHVNRLYALTS